MGWSSFYCGHFNLSTNLHEPRRALLLIRMNNSFAKTLIPQRYP